MIESNFSAPAWLFSFVDLAFLMLIAMTQIGDIEDVDVDFGEILVPRIHSENAKSLPRNSETRWQLRVHPREARNDPPFQLNRGEAAAWRVASEEIPPRMGPAALRERLGELQAEGARKPLLAPHQDSRSQDLLDAVALIEQTWLGQRRVAVLPSVGLR